MNNLLALLITSHSFAMNGIVTELKGTLTLEPSGTQLKKSEKISSGASVKLKGEVALITLDNGSVIKLKDKSKVTLTNDATPTVQLDDGALFTQVNNKNKEKTTKPIFFVRAKSAVMGVRGTKFFTAIGDKDNVWMCVGEGLVDLERKDEKIPVKEGQGVLVEKDKKIAPPKEYEWTKKLNWNMEANGKDIVDHSSLEGEYKNLLRQTYD